MDRSVLEKRLPTSVEPTWLNKDRISTKINAQQHQKCYTFVVAESSCLSPVMLERVLALMLYCHGFEFLGFKLVNPLQHKTILRGIPCLKCCDKSSLLCSSSLLLLLHKKPLLLYGSVWAPKWNVNKLMF